MTEHRARRQVRVALAWGAAMCAVALVGCTSTVTGSAVGSTSATAPTRSGSSSSGTSGAATAEDVDLELTIVATRSAAGTSSPPPGTAPSTSPSETGTDYLAAVTMVLAGVDGLPESALDSDTYIGTLDGTTTLWMKLPGATDSQIATARRALVGTWDFGMREVVGGTIDPTRCAALLETPQPDRLCDPATQEVLFLGRTLPVRPTATTSGGQDPQPGVTMTFTGEAKQLIADYTAAHVGDRLAITDGRGLLSAPTIQSPITEGAIRIAGNYTEAEARSLVGKLQLATADVTIRSDP